MDIQPSILPLNMITPPQESGRPLSAADNKDELRKACEQAEGLFASILLKEGLRPLFDETEASGSHAGGLMELAVETMAQDMGKEGALGIADSFYEQLSGNQSFRLTPIQRGEE